MFPKIANKLSCRMYLPRLEAAVSLLNSGILNSGISDANMSVPADPELAAHLRGCVACRQALEDAVLAGDLLREVRAPQEGPDQLFASRVAARIRARETQLHSELEFWNPIEVLARRVVWASSVLFLLLSSALYPMWGFHSPAPAQERITDRFPDLVPDQPSNKDEVLVSLAENMHE